jgi:hypothetical protein
MHLEFIAKEVTYTEALDGEIVQVVFQEYPDPDLGSSKTNMPITAIKNIVISASYELPPYEPQLEWCDGEEWGGGVAIKEFTLTTKSIKIVLKNSTSIDVNFKTNDITFQNIKRFLLSAGVD